MSPTTASAIKHLAGREPESAALRNVLAQLGACSSELCTEEMLFGLGGGIGFIYFLFDMHGGHPVVVGTRYHAKESDTPVFVMQMCEAWGAKAEVRHSSSPSAATKSLVKALEDGFTPIVWVEVTKLPYMFLSGRPNMYHTVVVYGVEGDEVIVGDLCKSVFRMSMEDLTEARNSNYAPKFRSLLIKEAPAKPDIRKMLSERIELTCSQMIDGLGISNFGLAAFKKWADMLTNTKNKKGWPACFSSGQALHGALSTVFVQIELRGYGGSAFRGMYADFIEQAAGVLKKPALKKVAEQFRESEASWQEIAFASLPETIPVLKETRAALTRRSVLLSKARTAEIDQELDALRDRLKHLSLDGRPHLREASAKDLSLSKADALDLFGAMRARVLETEAIERAAFTELRRIV